MDSTIYGFPIGPNGYNVIDSTIMLYWMPAVAMVGHFVNWQFPHNGGRKLHISASIQTAEATARAALPVLQRLGTKHKVVYPLDAYRTLNRGQQAGKLITIYSGRMMNDYLTISRALEVVLEPLVMAGRITPGPLPLDRHSGYTRSEQQLGGSRMLSFVDVDSFSG
jgi:hypothetical protein